MTGNPAMLAKGPGLEDDAVQLGRSVRLPVLLKRLRLKQLLPAATVAVLLGGCVPNRQSFPAVLYVAVSNPDGSQLTSESSALFRKRFSHLVKNFQRIHPNVVVQVALYPEAQLRNKLQQRNRAGLSPDLILTGSGVANTLLRAHLTDPLPESPELRSASSPELLHRLRNRQGQLAGQPLMVFPQLACYDRRRLTKPPTSVNGLLRISAAGVPVGLPMEARQLLWTAGTFGAIPGLYDASLGRKPNPQQTAQIRTWLSWMQQASDQQRFNFLPDQTSLREALIKGSVAWMSCSSGELDLLRKTMGTHLGVASLPNGDGHSASPVNRVRVLALGRNSSPLQRQMALALIHFSVGPLVQRSLTLESFSFLPSNPHVRVPVQSSGVLQAMVESNQQARSSERLASELHQGDPRLQSLQAKVIVPLLFGLVEPSVATERLIAILRRNP